MMDLGSKVGTKVPQDKKVSDDVKVKQPVATPKRRELSFGVLGNDVPASDVSQVEKRATPSPQGTSFSLSALKSKLNKTTKDKEATGVRHPAQGVFELSLDEALGRTSSVESPDIDSLTQDLQRHNEEMLGQISSEQGGSSDDLIARLTSSIAEAEQLVRSEGSVIQPGEELPTDAVTGVENTQSTVVEEASPEVSVEPELVSQSEEELPAVEEEPHVEEQVEPVAAEPENIREPSLDEHEAEEPAEQAEEPVELPVEEPVELPVEEPAEELVEQAGEQPDGEDTVIEEADNNHPTPSEEPAIPAEDDIREEEKSGPTVDVDASSAPIYNPFRRGMENDSLDALGKLCKAQQAIDASYKNKRLRVHLHGVWEETVGKVTKGKADPFVAYEGLRKNVLAHIATQQTTTSAVLKDIESLYRKWGSQPRAKTSEHYFSDATILAATLLRKTISATCGCVDVAANATSDMMGDNVVELLDFAGVFVAFSTKQQARDFADYLGQFFSCQVIGEVRHEAGEYQSDSIEGNEGDIAEDVMPQLDAVESEDDVEEDAPSEVEDVEEPDSYCPFQPSLVEIAVKGLDDAQVYQIWEDYKTQPRGLRAIFAGPMVGNDPHVGSSRYGNSYGSGYGGSYGGGYGGSYSGRYGGSYGGGYGSPYSQSYGGYGDGYGNTGYQRRGLFGRRNVGDQYGYGMSDSMRPSLFSRLFGPKVDRYGRPKVSVRKRISMAIQQGVEDSIAGCKSLTSLATLQVKLMRKIPRRKLRKIRQGRIYREQHNVGMGSLMAYKYLQFTLSKDSGVKDILFGDANSRVSGPTVVLSDFGELRCTFSSMEMADKFMDYMSDNYEVHLM